MELCGCAPLCDRCLEHRKTQHRGVAEARGWEHAAQIAGAPVGGRWKNTRERALQKARKHVADIAGDDDRLLDAFAELACKGAADRWRRRV